MDSLPPQYIDNLSVPDKREAYKKLARLCLARSRGTDEEQQLAKEAGFTSAETMRISLGNWGLLHLLPSTEEERPDTHSTKNMAEKKSPRRLRRLGAAKELPSAGNATELFKERLEALLESTELLRHMDENLRGKQFVRTNVEKAPVFYPRERLSDKEWEAVCEQYELAPEDKGFWATDAIIRLPGGVKREPSEIEATLISVYVLAGGRMDLLLNALHPPDSLPVSTEVQEEIRICVEGSKTDGDKKDGLTVLAGHLASWVRGGVVGQGRPSERSEVDHAFACRITHHRKQGLTDKEIARKESHRKKEDGTSYSVKDITELGDLGLS